MKAVLETWIAEQGLGALPVFALGVSAGASFALKLPKVTRINGVVSGARTPGPALRRMHAAGGRADVPGREQACLPATWRAPHCRPLCACSQHNAAEVLGVTQEYFETPTRLEGTYPPAVFIDMQRDTGGFDCRLLPPCPLLSLPHSQPAAPPRVTPSSTPALHSHSLFSLSQR